MQFPDTKKLRFIMQLADAGYSSSDKAKIRESFHLSEEEAEDICKCLQAYEPGIECDY